MGGLTLTVSVIIATKDRARYLERALESFGDQEDAPPFEVVVVDNGSTDDTGGVVGRAAASAKLPIRLLYEPEPNRGKARNRALKVAAGEIVVFCDDDVAIPRQWVAAHARAHAGTMDCVVNGPILNVPSYEDRPKPHFGNYSRAFLCTCNASVPRRALESVGGFDEVFDLYGWEDTELGVRLRDAGVRWRFAWNAYLWHVKLAAENTVAIEVRKAVEKARMAGRFLSKHPSRRARFATGAHSINLFRGRFMFPDALLALYAGLATTDRAPQWLRSLARAQLLDGTYTRELVTQLQRTART
ncbi:MAG: glycosyltransferase family 2 protein [Candidatus Eremiobacteraeota bacterium]|nr:glycosyltransferase family 2 protein [Candidatus Eremiobacteraeota bacterium]MBV8374119.1 glycosyltransferase family 2 protein [Candidatus Eremiobacteraeota bacterium]